jgi:ABC-type glycerol-3-phosphate transport system permease component
MTAHIKAPLWLRLLTVLVVIILVVFSLAPLVWMLSTSFKTTAEQTAFPPTIIPKNFTILPYIEGWKSRAFGRYFYNTALVSIITTLLCVTLSSLCGYGFSRYKLKGSNLILTMLFALQMFPTAVVIVPYFMGINKLGLMNTPLALIIAYTSFSLPLCVWMIKSFFDGIPMELDQAASIDGCSPFKTFLRIILPLARPGLIACVIFTFLGAWKEYLFALTLANNDKVRVISVAITSFIGEHSTSWNQMMAMGIISIIPVVLIFFFLQKYLISGMISGAVKS